VDWRIDIGVARERLGKDVPVQGNLDPIALFAPQSVLLRKVDSILEQIGNAPGHIFNLGHGFLPQTPVENVDAVIQRVAEVSARLRSS
jgi:uroporphyrinogen decarboxylase